jgi:hypothetical protein
MSTGAPVRDDKVLDIHIHRYEESRSLKEIWLSPKFAI